MHSAIGSKLETAPSSARSRLLSVPPTDILATLLVYVAVVLLFQGAGLGNVGHYVYWQDWADQSKYFDSARAFTRLDFDPSKHWYPLLYPLAISVFLWLPLFFAVVAVNAACYVATYVGFRQVAARFGLTPAFSAALFIATTLLGSTLSQAWLDPWTTTLSSALIWLALGRLCRDESGGFFVSGVLLALIPFCRPADVVVSALIGAMMIIRLRGAPTPWRNAAELVLGGLTIVAILGGLYLAIYGPHATDYMKLSTAYGLNLSWLGWKSVMLIIDPRPFYPYGSGVLQRFPWLAVGFAGLVAAALRPERRALALMIGAPALAYAAIMVAYLDLLPSGIWAFRNFHYFKWLTPAFGLFAFDFVRWLKHAKFASAAALAIVLAATSLHYEATLAGAGEPALLVVFKAPNADFGQMYFQRSVIDDAGGRQRNMIDYRQVPDARGLVYAEALRRDFSGGERWLDAPADVAWPLADPEPKPTIPLLGAETRSPIGRYSFRLAFGWPCWLPFNSCPRGLPGG